MEVCATFDVFSGGFLIVVAVNCVQAELLTGCKVQSVADAGVAISKLQQQGCRTVIITLGEKGAVFASQDDPAPVHVLCNHIKPLDTTVCFS